MDFIDENDNAPAAIADPPVPSGSTVPLPKKPLPINHLYRAFKRFLKIAAPVGSVLGVGIPLMLAVIFEYRNSGRPMLGAISVPQNLQARGYTPDAKLQNVHFCAQNG